MHSRARMGAIQNLLGKLGYVKLDRYGLLLTPEGRVLSQRPAVLDDGLGGRIVGWEDGDLAAMELERWQPAMPAKKPAKLRATASRVAVAMAPTIPAAARPQAPLAAKVVSPAAPGLPGVAPVVAAAPPAPPAPAPVVVAPPTPAPAVEADEPEEDDWEWVVAIARARAAAEEAEAAAAAPKFIPAQTQPMATVAKPAPVVATKHAVPAKPVPPPLPPPGEDTKLGVKSYEPPTRAPSPKTIIPVPQLPRATNTAFVRPAVTPVTPPLRRVPRATDRIVEDTVRTAPAPANDDKTSPGIALPPAGGGRKVAAKQR